MPVEGFVIGMTCIPHGFFHSHLEISIGAKCVPHGIMCH